MATRRGSSVSGVGGGAKRCGLAQRDGGSAVAAARRLRRIHRLRPQMRHQQRADVRVVALGRGWRDDSANGIVVVGSDGGARGEVHRSRRCAAAAADNADGDADVKLNLIYYYLFIYHYIVLIMHFYGETGLYSVGSFCSEPVEFWVRREVDFFVR